MSSEWTHLDARGQAHMVDVSSKEPTVREAVAEAFVELPGSTWEQIRDGKLEKGDVGATARIAGILAAKKTSELIPLCHPLALSSIAVEVELLESEPRMRLQATVRTRERTGVEMEALTAVSVAALTVYDMAKALDKGMTIGPIRLLSKSGGKSGDWNRE